MSEDRTQYGTDLVSVEDLRAEVAPVVARAVVLVVASPEQYQDAAGFLKAVKSAQKRVDDWFADPVKRAHEAWKALTTRKAETLAPLAEAEAAVKRKMVVYSQEQERIRAAEQARLQAEADERVRKERERIEALARAQREKEEAARREEERQRMLAAQARNEVERQRAAAAAEAARKAAEAAAAKAAEREDRAAAVPDAPVVTVTSRTPEVKGQSIRKAWKARITDRHAAAVALLAFPDWAAYVEIKEGELNRFAARTRGAVAVAGVEFFEDVGLASGSR